MLIDVKVAKVRVDEKILHLNFSNYTVVQSKVDSHVRLVQVPWLHLLTVIITFDYHTTINGRSYFNFLNENAL